MRIWTVKSKKCFYENLIQLTDIDYSQSKQLSNKNDLINLQRIRTIIHDHEISFVSVVIRNEQNYMQICTWFVHYQLHCLHFIFLQCGKENNNAISAFESKYCTHKCVFFFKFFYLFTNFTSIPCSLKLFATRRSKSLWIWWYCNHKS